MTADGITAPVDTGRLVSTGAGAIVPRVLAGAGWCGFAWYIVWQGNAGPPLVWSDTTSYETVAGHPLWSTGFWAGQRPPVVPLVLKAAGSWTGFLTLQTLIAVAAWGLLAFTVGRLVPEGWRRVVAVWVILAFATSTPIVLWNRSVLSESLSLSLLAVLLAVTIWMTRSPTWPPVAAVAVTALAFAATRDAQVWTVGLFGIGAAVVVLVRARRNRRFPRRLGVLAMSLLVAAGVTGWVVVHTGRSGQNAFDVMVVRIFPFPSRVAWFAAHGMPQARAVDTLAAATTPPPGAAKVVPVDPGDPRFAPLENWIQNHGESTLAWWAVTHPAYVITEPFERPERAYNDADGVLPFYGASGRVDSPVTSLLWPAWWWLLPMTVIAGAAATVTGHWRRRSWWVVMALGGLGILAMLVAWQGDGEEVARHTVEGFAQVRVCVLIVTTVGLLRLVPTRSEPDPIGAGPAEAGSAEAGSVGGGE